MPYYSSIREMNADATRACHGTLGGDQVWYHPEVGGQYRVRRAKTVKGDLYVEVVGLEKWQGPCAWGQIVRSRT